MKEVPQKVKYEKRNVQKWRRGSKTGTCKEMSLDSVLVMFLTRIMIIYYIIMIIYHIIIIPLCFDEDNDNIL